MGPGNIRPRQPSCLFRNSHNGSKVQTISRVEVDVGNSLAPHATLLMPHRLRCDSSWLDRVSKKLSVKADLAINSYIVTVSGQYLSVAITLSNKMDFSYCDNTVGFCKSSHILTLFPKLKLRVSYRALNMFEWVDI